MVSSLREAEASGRFAEKLQTYLKSAVLIVDEVGYLSLSRLEGNMVFQLVGGATGAARSSSRATRP
jgi:DNA replication protein DnaC